MSSWWEHVQWLMLIKPTAVHIFPLTVHTHHAPPLCPWSSLQLWQRCPMTEHPGVLWSGCLSMPSSAPLLPSRWNKKRSLWSPSCPDGGPGGFQSQSRSLWCTHTCCLCQGLLEAPWPSGTSSRKPAAPGGTSTWLYGEQTGTVISQKMLWVIML